MKIIQKSETPVLGVFRSWDLTRGDYLATGNYSAQIKESKEEYDQALKNYKAEVDADYLVSFKRLFPQGAIKVEKNKRGLFYRLRFNEKKAVVYEKLERHGILMLHEDAPDWRAFDCLDEVI